MWAELRAAWRRGGRIACCPTRLRAPWSSNPRGSRGFGWECRPRLALCKQTAGRSSWPSCPDSSSSACGVRRTEHPFSLPLELANSSTYMNPLLVRSCPVGMLQNSQDVGTRPVVSLNPKPGLSEDLLIRNLIPPHLGHIPIGYDHQRVWDGRSHNLSVDHLVQNRSAHDEHESQSAIHILTVGRKVLISIFGKSYLSNQSCNGIPFRLRIENFQNFISLQPWNESRSL